jgi:hypothetical protein
MKSVKSFALVTLFVMVQTGYSQWVHWDQNQSDIRLTLDKIGVDINSKQGMSLIPIFKVSQSHIHDYLDIVGADFKSTLDSVKIIPPIDAQGELSYGYFFKLHQKNLWEPNRIPFVIENGAFWYRKKHTRMWLDRNHDLNFQNETPDTFFFGKSKGYIWLNFDTLKSSGIKAEAFPSEKFYRFSELNDKSIQEMSNGRMFLGTASSLRIEKANIRYNQLLFGSDTLALGILDVNSNGIFGDAHIDRWVLSIGGSHATNQHEFTLSKKSSFAWMGYGYEITWDTNQQSVFMKPIKGGFKGANSLIIGDPMPCFKFCVAEINKKRESSHKLQKKPTVFVVWSAENLNFIRDSADLHSLIRNTSDSLQWVFLNFGGSGKYVSQYNKRYDIAVKQGFCNSSIATKLKFQQLPQYFFWDEKRQLQGTFSNIRDVIDHIKKSSERTN